MKTLRILSFVPVLLFGPIFWLAKLMFFGRRAILTIPLCLVMAYAVLMAYVLLSEREESRGLAETPKRDHTVAAASEPSAPLADVELGIHGEVAKFDGVIVVSTFDPHTRESTGNAIVRNCGPINPDAPANSAPRGDVVLIPQNTPRGVGTTYHLRDADGNRWLVASGDCPTLGEAS